MPQPALFLEILDFAGLSLEWSFAMEELPEMDA
jgi:hypothetical protein